MAELLLDHYPDERETAVEHLDLAITELREMKMAPLLEKGYFLARLASVPLPRRSLQRFTGLTSWLDSPPPRYRPALPSGSQGRLPRRAGSEHFHTLVRLDR